MIFQINNNSGTTKSRATTKKHSGDDLMPSPE